MHAPRHTEVVGELFTGLVAGLDTLYARNGTEQLELIRDYLENAAEIQHAAALDLAPTPAGAPEHAAAPDAHDYPVTRRSRP